MFVYENGSQPLLPTFFYIFCLCYSVFLTSLSRLSLQVSAVCLAFLLFFISFDTVFIFSCFTALFSLYSLSLARNKHKKKNGSQKKKQLKCNDKLMLPFPLRHCAGSYFLFLWPFLLFSVHVELQIPSSCGTTCQ